MADFVGRRLGIPSIGLNPATWGRAFREQEPAVESVSVRTADAISLLEAFVAGDRRVSMILPRSAAWPLLLCTAALGTSVAVFAPLDAPQWLRTSGVWAAIIAVVMFALFMHPVKHFTKT